MLPMNLIAAACNNMGIGRGTDLPWPRLPDVPEGVRVFKSFDDAIHYLCTPPVCNGIETIWNVGGSEIFALGLEHPAFNRLYFTRIFGDFEADTFFPNVEWSMLKRVRDPEVPEGIQEENGVHYQYEVYERAF